MIYFNIYQIQINKLINKDSIPKIIRVNIAASKATFNDFFYPYNDVNILHK